MRRNSRVGYVPQDAEFPESRTVHEIVAEAIRDEHLDDLERGRAHQPDPRPRRLTDGSLRTESLSGG